MACQIIRDEDGTIKQVLAHNGKPSKLYASLLPLTDNNASQALRLWAQTQTPTFKAWFGESKVVDENGEPLIVYHGTTFDFSSFNKERVTYDETRLGTGWSKHFEGFHFAADANTANKFIFSGNEAKGNVMPVFLSIQSLKSAEDSGNPYLSLEHWDSEISKAIREGNNGLKYFNKYEGNDLSFIAFEPNQIKSVFNKGQFSSYSPNIYNSKFDIDYPSNPFSTQGKLKTMLDKLTIRFNIPYTIVNEPKDTRLGWFNTQNGVTINMAKAQATTPFHEFLHPFIMILEQENPALYQELARQIYFDQEGARFFSELHKHYPELGWKDMAHEAIVTYISRVAAQKYVQKKNLPILERLLNWIKSLFKKTRMVDFKNLDFNTKLEDISDMIIDDAYTADLKAAMRNGDVLIREERDTNITYESLFNRIKNRLSILRATLRTRKQGEAFRDDIEALSNIFESANEITSINTFVVNALSYVEATHRRFESLRASVKDPSNLNQEDISHNLYVLGEIQQLLNVYESLNDVQLLYYREGQLSTSDTMAKLSEAIAKHRIMAQDFKEFALTYITEWLFQYIEPVNQQLIQKGYTNDVLSKDEFRDQLEMAMRDISTGGYLLGASINSQDPISAAVGLALKDIMYTSHVQNVKTRDALEAAFKKIEGTPLYTTKTSITEFNMQFLKTVEQHEVVGYEDDGSPIYDFVPRLAFHTPFNDDQFEKERINFFRQLGPRPSRANVAAYRTWQKAVTQWYTQNTQIVANANSIIQQKKATLTRRQFDRWLLENTREIDEELFSSGAYKSDYFKARGLFYISNPRRGTFRIYSGQLIQPANKYRNAEFNTMMQNSYYKTLYSEYKASNDKLGLYGLRFGIIPQVPKKGGILDVDKNKTLGQNIVNVLKQPIRAIKADPESSRTIQRQDETEVKRIPIRYTGMVQEPSVDLLGSVIQFSQMANNYENMTEVEPNILVLKTVLNGDFNLKIEGRKIAKTNSKGKQIINAITKLVVPKLAKDDMLNKRLNEFIDDVVYGESELINTFELFGREISMNKLADKVGMFTSLSTMALNLTGGINNVVVGNFNNLIEAVGKRFYTPKDWLWAQKTYWTNMPAFIGDLVGMDNSLIGHLSTHYDVPQGEFIDQYGSPTSQGTLNRLFKVNNLFFIQNGGEHEIQLTGMLALMHSTKVNTTDGNEITLFDAWKRSSNNYLHTSPFNNPAIQWTEEQDRIFRNQLHAITKKLQGIYNQFDKSVLARRWYGKLAIKYRKYMFSSFKNLYGARYIDYELGTVEQGNWNLFMEKIWKDLKDYKWGMINRMWTKEGYNEIEKAAINKTLAHFAVIFAAFTLVGMMSGGGDDDDKTWLDAEATLQITRFSADITQYINPSDFLRVIRNPAASINLIEKIIDWSHQLFSPTEKYQRAAGIAKKGDNKLFIKTLKILPVSRQIINILTPEEQQKFYNMTTR